MDNFRLIGVVKQFPQVWDRNCVSFRERDHKQAAWDRIGEVMGCSANACKDMFKSLREKYIREREKQSMFADKYMPWQHLEALSFLDPHIVLRKQSLNYEEDLQRAEEYKSSFDGDSELEASHSDFDKTLIALVRKATPIWDRKSNSYPSKQLKYQLWKTIAQTMNKDVNVCMIRWKGLREKYIRQKTKYEEQGEGKWEFLDEMSFLDKVIQYRRKHCELDTSYRQVEPRPPDISNFYFESPNPGEMPCRMPPGREPPDDFVNDSSSSDFVAIVKNESFDAVHQDSSYDSGMTSSAGRKRSASDNSEASVEKRHQRAPPEEHREQEKSPEQMFGDLVAAMLAKKTDEREKNIVMIEIMKILTK